MSYPGNASLSPEIQSRILSTFEQTRELASNGNQQEALLGCDFILRLDPQFAPAKKLMERLKAGPGEGPVEVGDLDAAPEAEAAPEPPVPEPEALELETGVMEPPASPPLPADQALEAGLAELLERRELKRLVQVAEENRREVAADPKLRKIVETAYSRLEAEPYLESFLGSARQAVQDRDGAEAERLLAKAKSLDPTHPGIAEIEQARGFYEEPGQVRGAADRGGETATGRGQAATPAQEPPAFDSGELETFQLVDEETPAAAGTGAGPGGEDLPALEPPPPLAEPPPPEPASAAGSLFQAAPSTPAGAAAGSQPAAGGNGRIQELLGEGQSAFDRGDYQEAIDSWSRIFLIDIDHQEAARRIEQARRHKAEGERQVEEVYHEAMTALDGGDTQTARQAFQRVLQLQPGHLAAREYLEQMEEGETPALTPPPPAKRLETLPIPEEAAVGDEPLKEEIIIPPPPGTQPAAAARPPAAPAPKARAAGSRRNFAAIGGAVLVLVVLIGAFAYLKRDRLFRNTDVPQTEEQQTAPDPVDRATRLYEAGEVERALRQLRGVGRDHPRYQEAQELIAQWAALPEAATPEAEEAGPPPELAARWEQLLALARRAYSQGEYLTAMEGFHRAEEIAPLDGTAADLEADTLRQLEPLKKPLDLFRQREWEFVLPTLWRMHQADPGNRDVVRLMVDSYYNLAVRALQRYNPTEAAEHLEEALALDPDSTTLKRHKLFAETYSSRPQDLLYELYIKYLPFSELNLQSLP